MAHSHSHSAPHSLHSSLPITKTTLHWIQCLATAPHTASIAHCLGVPAERGPARTPPVTVASYLHLSALSCAGLEDLEPLRSAASPA